MRTIGIRVAPKKVTFAIFDDEEKNIVNVEGITVPQAFETPDALKYIRSNLLDIIREYGVEKAGIRTTEPIAQSLSIPRIQMEGVIQEAFASSSLISYFAGPIATIASKLGIPRADVKKIIEGENKLEIERWEKMDDKEREAVLAAVGATNV